MVFRALGEVDEALGKVDANDAAGGAEDDRRVRHRMLDQQGVEQRSARLCRG